MLVRKNGKIIGCGERVETIYGETVVIASWTRTVIPSGRKRRTVTIEIETYRHVLHNQAAGYEVFAPYQLKLEWRE